MTVIESETLGAILMGYRLNNDFGIYIIRDHETGVIYVGSSKRIGFRLRNDHRRDNSPLWQEILKEMPGSLTWTVDIEPLKRDTLFGYNARKREAELIQEHTPYLNEYMQPEPSLR